MTVRIGSSFNQSSLSHFHPWFRHGSQTHAKTKQEVTAVAVETPTSLPKEERDPMRAIRRHLRSESSAASLSPDTSYNTRPGFDRAPRASTTPFFTTADQPYEVWKPQFTVRGQTSAAETPTVLYPEQLKFASLPPPKLFRFGHSEQTPTERSLLKRRRAVTDVDGPNTASLSCKKRRLRRNLITSRLSQPFSLPATHIINRESLASGDRRFLKLAAITNARRIMQLPVALPPPHHQQRVDQGSAVLRTPAPTAGLMAMRKMIPLPQTPPPSELMWRAAIGNSLRQRISKEAEAGNPATDVPLSLKTTARLQQPSAAWLTAASFRPASFLTAETRTEAKFAAGRDAAKNVPAPYQAHSMSHMAMVLAKAMPSGRNEQVYEHNGKDASRDSNMDMPTIHGDTSGRDRSEEDDGYSYAFPVSGNANWYEDDPEDVYSDFSVLFSASAEDIDSSEEGFDDYMDELDGIAHLPRG